MNNNNNNMTCACIARTPNGHGAHTVYNVHACGSTQSRVANICPVSLIHGVCVIQFPAHLDWAIICKMVNYRWDSPARCRVRIYDMIRTGNSDKQQ